MGDGESAVIPGLMANFHGLFLRRVDHTSFAGLPGFQKGKHFEPEKFSSNADLWAKSLLEDQAKDEWKKVIDNCKRALGLRHSQVHRHFSEGCASVETSLFSFLIETGQDRRDPTRAFHSRRLKMKVGRRDLPASLDEIFPVSPHEIVVPIQLAPAFSELMDAFEDIRDLRGGELTDDEESGRLEYIFPKGKAILTVDILALELVLRSRLLKGPISLLEAAEENLAGFAAME